jgi:hypothetical protein
MLVTAYTSASVGPAKPIQLEVNGPIQFAVEKDHIFVLDHERKEFRLNIVKTTLKTR